MKFDFLDIISLIKYKTYRYYINLFRFIEINLLNLVPYQNIRSINQRDDNNK